MSVQHIATYRSAIDNTSDTFDHSIAKMSEFIKKCTALADEMKSLDGVAGRVREIRQTVDVLEKTAERLRVLQ